MKRYGWSRAVRLGRQRRRVPVCYVTVETTSQWGVIRLRMPLYAVYDLNEGWAPTRRADPR